MITIEIQNTVTGEVIVETDEYEYPNTYQAVWQWTEGNYGCDCNRALFFARARGLDDPNHSCGDGIAYRIRIRDPMGVLLHDEFTS